MYGSGDVVIGINFVIDNVVQIIKLFNMFDELIIQYDVFIQFCVLIYVINIIEVIECGVLVDLVFQFIGGIEVINNSFGVLLVILQEVCEVVLFFKWGMIGDNVMYFEIGQGSVLLVNGYYGVDQ